MSVYALPASVQWPINRRNVPLWAMFDRIKDVGHPDEEMLSVYREHGVIKKSSRDDNTNQTAENRNIYQLIDEGWFVVNRMKAWQGSVGISSLRGIVSGHYICFRPRHGEDPRYLNWLLRSGIYALEYARMSRGVRPGQIEIDNDELHGLRIALPPHDEQRRIADFLDAETSQIDQMRYLQTSVLEKLDQRDRAVRDGLVDRLVGQIGELPLRRYASKIEQGSSPSCENYPRVSGEWGVLKLSAVKGGRFYPEENKQLPDSIEPVRQYEVREGDLLISRANTPELVGDVAVVKDIAGRLLLPDLIYRVGLGKGIKAEFAAQVFLSTRIRGLIQATARGSSQSMVKLRGEDIREWPIPRANAQQQDTFVSAITDQLESSARLRAAVHRQLALLSERRQALVTAAVTGGISV